MKVLHVYKTYLPTSMGGTERVIWEMAEAGRACGVQTTVLSLAPGARTEPIGTHTGIYVRRDAKFASTDLSLSAFGAFARAAREADIVHYHVPWPLADLLYFHAGRNRPAIVTYHSDIVRQKRLNTLYAPLLHAFLSRVDRIVATSPAYAETSPVLARHRDRTVVIPIGIGARTPYAPQLRESLRERLGTGFFLFVGELRYYKGVSFLLEAARLAGLPVVVAGSGEMAGEIARAVVPNLTFLGRVSDEEKEALLDLCGAFVFPSHLRSEAFGVALLEAARAARAMICCEIGTGTTYVNVDGETGLAVPPGDPVALAAAMTRLAANRQTCEEMGRRAAQRYSELFRADIMAGSYRDLYDAVLLERRPAHAG